MKLLALSFEQHYLPGKPVLPLLAACEFSPDSLIMRACVTDQCALLQSLFDTGYSLHTIAEKLGIAILDFSAPWRLQPVTIPKPWGQEIWYTGIEARGVSSVVSDTGVTPLSWTIALDQQRVLGAHAQPNLLKILDPLPDEVFGDLYFELHEQKREVYVVTHVDERAWPEGVGAIRYGFSQDKRAQFSDQSSFFSAYRDAVREYQLVRRELDGLMDALREREGIALLEPVSAAQTQRWLTELPQDLRSREATLRATMEAFTALRELRVGDVVAVPLFIPHALQHGVRTVEFQTPVYERKILSFAQKVLTQDHWDTDEALQLAHLQTPADEAFPQISNANGVVIEQIVAFEDFTVQRIYLEPGAKVTCELGQQYGLLMGVSGQVGCEGVLIDAEQAVLFPASANCVSVTNTQQINAVMLLARPV